MLVLELRFYSLRKNPADFDGDCDLMFYPPTLAAKNEILETLVWKKQLISSHNRTVIPLAHKFIPCFLNFL